MRTRFGPQGLVVAMVAACAMALGGSAHAEARVLTLGFDKEDEVLGLGGDELYVGAVRGPAECRAERVVSIRLKQRGDRRFRPVRRGETDAEGRFEITAPRGSIPPGRYIAVATARAGCRELRSAVEAFPVSRVTIGFPGGGRVGGEVRSSDPDCEAGRTVLLFRRAKGERGYRRVGRDRTSGSGAWSVRPDGGLTVGRYYARALEQGSCGVDRSPRVSSAG